VKVDAVQIRTRSLQRRDPAWKTASYSASEVVGVYVGIEADGLMGVGATAAHPRRLSPEALVGQLTETIRPALVGHPVEAAYSNLAKCGTLHARARIAVDLALFDLFGKLAGLPAEVLWGGPIRDRISVIRMVGLKPPEEVCDAVAPLYEAGLRGFKVKIGDSLERDVDRIRRIRSTFGTEIKISADANGAYDLPSAIALCEQLAELDVMCIEQPLPYDDLPSMVALCEASKVPIMADQMVSTAADVVRVANAGAAHMVSLKLTKMGSVAACIQVVDVCEAMGLGVHLGGSAAPGILDSALTRLAMAHPAIEPYAEVGESMALIDDDVAGVTYSGEWATSDGQPGLGGTPLVFEA
jgi:L-alanine-DL-glutamate epimerase-like enolase superfamily enzyme